MNHTQTAIASASFTPRSLALKRALPHLVALFLYLVLAIVVTWPLAAHITTGVVGQDQATDSYQHIWHQWWVAYALTHWQNPFFTNLLYYPDGIDLFWQTLGFTQGLVAIPVTLTLGPVAGANFTIFSSFVIGGYAVFLLARRLTGSFAGGLVAGAIYAFSPYHMQKMSEGSIELTSIHWLPLYVWALDVLLERPNWRRAFLASFLLLWVSLGAWYYGLFAVLFTGCAVGLRVLRELARSQESGVRSQERTSPLAALLSGGELAQAALNTPLANPSPTGGEGLNRFPTGQFPRSAVWERGAGGKGQRLRRSLIIGLWGVLPLLIWALVLAPKIATVNQSVDQASWDMRASQITHSADIIDFILPSPIHPLWGAAIREWRTDRFPDVLTYWNVSLGLVGLPLALIGLITGWRANWRWGILLLATMILAMGPILRFAGVQTHIPLPFALIQSLPGVRIGQRPSHMAVLTILMVAILAAYGVARLVRGRTLWATLAVVSSLLLSIVAIDGMVERERLTIYSRTVHPFYATLPPADGALMTLPMYVNTVRIEHMTNQIVHHWPIFAGYVARPPAYRFVYETNGISQLREGRADADDIINPGWPESGRRALAAYRIRYVTLDLTSERGDAKLAAGKPEYFAAVRQLLMELGVGTPLTADADLEAYAIPRDWPIGPIASLGEGWRAIEHQPGTQFRWRWMGEQSTIRMFNPYEQPIAASLRLDLASYIMPRSVRVLLDGKPLGELPVETTPHARTIAFMLPPGAHIVTLAAQAQPDPTIGGQLTSVRAFGIAFSFAQPEPLIP